MNANITNPPMKLVRHDTIGSTMESLPIVFMDVIMGYESTDIYCGKRDCVTPS